LINNQQPISNNQKNTVIPTPSGILGAGSAVEWRNPFLIDINCANQGIPPLPMNHSEYLGYMVRSGWQKKIPRQISGH